MPKAEGGQTTGRVLIDAGVFIGALLRGDPRHAEARPYDPSEAAQAVRLLVEPPSAIAGGHRLPPKPRPFRFIPNRHRAAIRSSAMLDFLCLLYS